MDTQHPSETDKVREALATRVSGFPLIAGRSEIDDQRNTLARAAGKHSARRFSGALISGFGALAIAASAHAGGMQTNDAWTGADKTKHELIGAAIGSGVTAATGKPWAGFATGVVFAAAKELYDSRHPLDHTCSLQDLLMTAAGAALGSFTTNLVLTYHRGRTGVAVQRSF